MGDYHRSTYTVVIQYIQGKESNSKRRFQVHAKLLKLFRFYEPLKIRPVSMVAEIKANTLYFTMEFSIRYKMDDGNLDPLLGQFDLRSGWKNV